MNRNGIVLCFTLCMVALVFASSCARIAGNPREKQPNMALAKGSARRITITDPQPPLEVILQKADDMELPPDARQILNIEYTRTPQGPLILDLYLPAKADGPLPLIVWIHGGGWLSNDYFRRSFAPTRMVERGYAVASIVYRGSDRAKFPAQIQDCKTAIRYLRANAAKYNIDPDNIGAWGVSAGGHLAALAGTSDSIKEFEGADNPGISSRIKAVCNYCGPVDFFKMETAETSQSAKLIHKMMTDLIGGELEENCDKVIQVNPITHIDSNDAPMIILHGDKDNMVPLIQSELLYEGLKAKGVEVTFAVVKDGVHGFIGPEIDRVIDAFFDKHLKNTGNPK